MQLVGAPALLELAFGTMKKGAADDVAVRTDSKARRCIMIDDVDWQKVGRSRSLAFEYLA